MAIPPPLELDFEPARSYDDRSRSFGALTEARRPLTTFHDHVRGTLHDQGIFGPVHDLRCFCGKYSGDRHKGMICDRCGVKVALKACRATRFGHIEFRSPMEHPLSRDLLLHCFPVMPGQILQSPAGALLADAYDQLVVAANRHCVKEITNAANDIIAALAPVAVLLHRWHLEGAILFAYGLALTQKSPNGDSPQFCSACGYLLSGLRTSDCPGCGTSLS